MQCQAGCRRKIFERFFWYLDRSPESPGGR